jgi:hypothetical protein
MEDISHKQMMPNSTKSVENKSLSQYSTINNSSMTKQQRLKHFWQKQTKEYYETKVASIDRGDLHDP